MSGNLDQFLDMLHGREPEAKAAPYEGTSEFAAPFRSMMASFRRAHRVGLPSVTRENVMLPSSGKWRTRAKALRGYRA